MEYEPLSNPELYINRQLSLLEFNRRLLAQVIAQVIQPLPETLEWF